ncbi:MAG: hypothetical protein Q9169_007911 [Polycauliona sp. 2 TL-2023]
MTITKHPNNNLADGKSQESPANTMRPSTARTQSNKFYINASILIATFLVSIYTFNMFHNFLDLDNVFDWFPLGKYMTFLASATATLFGCDYFGVEFVDITGRRKSRASAIRMMSDWNHRLAQRLLDLELRIKQLEDCSLPHQLGELEQRMQRIMKNIPRYLCNKFRNLLKEDKCFDTLMKLPLETFTELEIDRFRQLAYRFEQTPASLPTGAHVPEESSASTEADAGSSKAVIAVDIPGVYFGPVVEGWAQKIGPRSSSARAFESSTSGPEADAEVEQVATADCACAGADSGPLEGWAQQQRRLSSDTVRPATLSALTEEDQAEWQVAEE